MPLSLYLRPYLVNLLPCLTRITKRQEETVQETLASSIPKIMAALGNFANDTEIKVQNSIKNQNDLYSYILSFPLLLKTSRLHCVLKPQKSAIFIYSIVLYSLALGILFFFIGNLKLLFFSNFLSIYTTALYITT